MALSISQIIADARSTVVRLHENDKLTDNLMASLQSVNERINCMKEYRDEVFDFNEVLPDSARSVIVKSLQQENRQMRMLEEENKQLKIVLKEHQTALDLIMSRYRQQMVEMIKLNKLQEVAKEYVAALGKILLTDSNTRLVEFARIVNEIITHGEEQSEKDIEEIARLQIENKTLRQLLLVATSGERGCQSDVPCACSYRRNVNAKNCASSSAAVSSAVETEVDDKTPEVVEVNQSPSTQEKQALAVNHAQSEPKPVPVPSLSTGSSQSDNASSLATSSRSACNEGDDDGHVDTPVTSPCDSPAANCNSSSTLFSPKAVVSTAKGPAVKKPHLTSSFGSSKLSSTIISRRRSAGSYLSSAGSKSDTTKMSTVTNGILLAKKKGAAASSDDSPKTAKTVTAPRSRFSFGGRITSMTTTSPKTHTTVSKPDK